MGKLSWIALGVLFLPACSDDGTPSATQVDAGPGGTDAGAGGTDAGAGGTDAGAGGTDASPGGTDAGAGGADAGADTGAGGATDGGIDGGADAPDDTTYGLSERPSNPSCVAPPRPAVGALSVRLEPRFADLTFGRPVGMVPAPGDNNRFYVIEKRGTVQLVTDGGTPSKSLFLDITSEVNSTPSEAGLLGMTFHPNYQQNQYVYLSYTQHASIDSGLQSVIYRYRTVAGGTAVEPASRTLIFGPLDQPFDAHNAGCIAFGPDGYLYLALGDGGYWGDPFGHGQNAQTLFGKILRMDVDGGTPYAIPPTNPFGNEVFALGLRNPWRFSFDRETGEIWAGDVGEDSWEEVNKIVRGGNYGWSIREGAHCYDGDTCATEGLIDPVAEYDHTVGVSVTGGYVYRGSMTPEAQGMYLYGDHGTGNIWGIPPGQNEPLLLNPSGPNLEVTSFAEEHDGELSVVDYGTGRIFRLELVPGSANGSTFPATLSQTGCVNPQDATQVVAGAIPYDLNTPLWSDGADKERFLAIPDGATIEFADDGDWDFPIGTVLIKTFSIQGKRLETRLFVRHEDGAWGGYSYEWNAQQTDADLIPGGKSVPVGSQQWYYPTRSECFRCHTATAGRALGPEMGQLNRSIVYPSGVTANQLATLEHIGMFKNPLPGAPSTLEAFPDPLDPAAGSLQDRAKAYMHGNCSNCHRPGATGQGPMDFRYQTPFAEMQACDVAPLNGNLGVDNARIVAPGDPSRSVISVRMRTLQVGRMPPLASSVVDAEGTAVVDGWIVSLTGCPSAGSTYP